MKAEFAEVDQPLAIDGVRLASAAAGIRSVGRDDLALVELCPKAETTAVFTQNKFCAAPVIVAREHIATARPRFLLFNSGNANAGTGAKGVADARAIVAELARIAGCSDHEVLPFSTGVIGERLDCAKIIAVVPELFAGLASKRWQDAATAIMTTDTVAKYCSVRVTIDGVSYSITGMAKGSGMIHPNMATMLAFIATDADVEAELLNGVLTDCVNQSFNRITVDGDTSTNDACVLAATKRVSDGQSLTPRHSHWSAVIGGISRVCQRLARSIVRDGEGATKFVEISVESASETDSLAVANTVAQSPLVKTALFAGDPNWGRILAAVGRAPVSAMEVRDVSIWLGDYQIVENGEPIEGYDEPVAAEIMAQEDIVLHIAIGNGSVGASVWTCDLSYEYVRINAEYRS